MEVDAQRVDIGLTTVAVYGLLALGYVVNYRASQVLNFAEAGVGAVGAYLLYDLMEGSGGGWGRFLLALAAGQAAERDAPVDLAVPAPGEL
jgi:branched-subunit amino acid ABC-type transport system permease component